MATEQMNVEERREESASVIQVTMPFIHSLLTLLCPYAYHIPCQQHSGRFFKLSRLTLHLKKFNPFIFIVITDMVGVIYVP